MLQGCTSIEDVTSDYDFVLGADYVAPVRKLSEELPPSRILFLPIQKNITPAYTQNFVEKFTAGLTERNLILPSTWGERKSVPSREEVERLAQESKCEVVLFVTLEQISVYPPLHLKADVMLQKISNDQVLWSGVANYDAGQDDVASSARRYVQQKLKKTSAPDKSLSILRNNYLFIQFAASHLAQHLNRLAAPPPPSLEAQEQKKASQKETTKR
ncbi:MAG: hypothetical protein ACOY3I_09655 [Verrucomicrobiota bacterium]